MLLLPARNRTARREIASRNQARRRQWLVGLTFGLLCAVPLRLGPVGPRPAEAAQPGDPLPDFQLPWLTGEEAPSARALILQTSPTVLVVWNRGCPRCTELALQVDALADSLRPRGGACVGLLFGPDDPGSLLMLLEDHEVTTPHLWDESGSTARQLDLGVHHLAVLLLDDAGIVRARLNDQIASLPEAVMARVRAMPTGIDGSGPERPSTRRQVGSRALPAGEENQLQTTETRAETPAQSEAEARSRVSPEIDGRLRAATYDGARANDLGLYGEALENGALFLYRCDLRWRWSPARGLSLIPWLRLSNEDETSLTEGAEQFARRHGTASLQWRGSPRVVPGLGRFLGRVTPSADLGAFPARISPLLLQRWDREDAPPLGGVSGCGVCAAGAAGLGQKSLEILGPDYQFEGARAGLSTRWTRLQVAAAVPRWEKRVGPLATDEEKEAARYRRVLSLAAIDLGRAGREDPGTGLPRPWGLRLAALGLDDDLRTINRSEEVRPPEERDEHAWALRGAVDPFGLWDDVMSLLGRPGWAEWTASVPRRGLALEAERVWWRLDTNARDPVSLRFVAREFEATGTQAGARWEPRFDLAPHGAVVLSGRAHWIRTEPDFEPYYRALTYRQNREGGRFALGAEFRDANGAPRAGVELFARVLRQVEDDPDHREVPGGGRIEERITSVSVTGRPHRKLPVGLHAVRTESILPPLRAGSPAVAAEDRRSDGLSLDLGWEGHPAVEPMLRFDWIDLREGFGAGHAVTQAQFQIRVTG